MQQELGPGETGDKKMDVLVQREQTIEQVGGHMTHHVMSCDCHMQFQRLLQEAISERDTYKTELE